MSKEAIVVEEVMKNPSFQQLMSEAGQEMMQHKSFNQLMANAKEELEKQGSTTLKQLHGHELIQHDIFKQLAKLKDVVELIRYQETPKKATTATTATKVPAATEPIESDEVRLHKLFGKVEENKMLLAIVDDLKRGVVHKPEPKFFDGLQYVLETHFELIDSVRRVEVVLDSDWGAFADNIFDMPSVLALLIEESKLEILTLRKFDPESLVAVLTASLGEQTALKELDLQDNSLKTTDLLWALSSLPWPSPKGLVLKLNGNRLIDEPELSNNLPPGLTVAWDNKGRETTILKKTQTF